MCLGTADARFFSVQACRRQKQRWGGPGTRASQCVAGAHGGRESQVDVSRERSRVRWLARTGAAVAPGGVPMESVELEGGGLRAAGCGLRSAVGTAGSVQGVESRVRVGRRGGQRAMQLLRKLSGAQPHCGAMRSHTHSTRRGRAYGPAQRNNGQSTVNSRQGRPQAGRRCARGACEGEGCG